MSGSSCDSMTTCTHALIKLAKDVMARRRADAPLLDHRARATRDDAREGLDSPSGSGPYSVPAASDGVMMRPEANLMVLVRMSPAAGRAVAKGAEPGSAERF